MLFTLALAIAVAAVMLAIVLAMKRRGGEHRGNLLGPPRGLGGAARPAPPPPMASAPAAADWPEAAAPIGDLPDPVAAEARALLANGHKIEAIKLVRAATGCSLGEAVERIERL